MTALFASLLVFLVTYVVASDVVFLSTLRVLGRERSTQEDLFLFVVTRGAGAPLLSIVFYYLLLLAPHRSTGFYLFAGVAVLAVLFVFGLPHLPRLGAAYRATFSRVLSAFAEARAQRGLAPLLAAAAIALAAVIVGVGFPIVEHDALAAGVEARIMARDASMETYLNVRQADGATGYYMPTFRTPYLQTLYVWFSVAAGSEQMDLLARTVSPVFGFHCLFLLGFLSYRRGGPLRASWAVFLLASTPLFFSMMYDNGIDTSRLYLALVACAWFARSVEGRGREFRVALVAGLLAGFAVYSHPLGVFAIAGGGLVLLLSKGRTLRNRMAVGALLGLFLIPTSAVVHYVSSRSVISSFSAQLQPERVRQELRELRQAAVRARSKQPADRQGGSSEPPQDQEAPSALEAAPVRASTSAPAIKTPATKAPSAKVPTASATPDRGFEPKKPRAVMPVLVARGQGNTPFSRLFFGRLQMFSGLSTSVSFSSWVGCRSASGPCAERRPFSTRCSSRRWQFVVLLCFQVFANTPGPILATLVPPS